MFVCHTLPLFQNCLHIKHGRFEARDDRQRSFELSLYCDIITGVVAEALAHRVR